MMKITKDCVFKKIDLEQEDFKCKECGCEFTADYDEYYADKGSSCTTLSAITYAYHSTVTDTYVCSCPKCHKIVIKTKQRIEERPTITLTGTSSAESIPDYCKNCSNHPSNGGDGNCNCVLGSMGQIIK